MTTTDQPQVKICGLNRPEAVDAAAAAGADYLGFVHFPPSPRHVSMAAASALAARAQGVQGAESVLLLVDPDDETARAAAQTDCAWAQIHKVHDPARAQALRALIDKPLILAAPIAEAADFALAEALAEAADMLLLDAKAPSGAVLPGGNGLSFDWRLLSGRRMAKPWMLAGGLTPDNVAEAVRLTQAARVDVSSGVESAPGIKDPDRIRAFIAAVKATRF